MAIENVYSSFRPVDLGSAYSAGLGDRETKMRLKDLAKQREEDDAITNLKNSSVNEDGTFNNQTYLSGLAKISPEKAMQYGEQMRQNSAAELEANRQKINRVGNALEGLAGMSEADRKANYPQYRMDLIKSGAISPEDAPEQYDSGLFRQTYAGWRSSDEYLNREKKNAEIAKLNADAKTDPEMKRLSLEKMRAETAKLRAEADKSGRARTRELPADKVLSVNEGNAIPTMLSDVDKTIGANSEMFGPVSGRLASANPYNEKTQTIDSQVRAASQAFGRYMEGGVLRKEDEDKYRKMFPNLSDTPEVAKNKLAVVSRLLSQRQNSNVNALRAQGFDVSGVDQGLAVADVPEIIAGSGSPSKSGGVIRDANAAKSWDSVETNPQYFNAMKFLKNNPNDPRAKQILEKLRGGR